MKTAIVYTPRFQEHLVPFGHPERPERVAVIAEALQKSGLDLLWFEPKEIGDELLTLCHTPEYVALVQREVAALQQNPALAYLSTGDVVISPNSFDVAKLAVGAVIQAVDSVMTGVAKNSFAIVRPPGHHATKERGMGFCLFNNVALGARYVQKAYKLERVAIIDWDLHHGNGTEDIFYNDPSVLYFSTHQAGIYPGTGTESKGTMLNIPITAGKESRETILQAFHTTLKEQLALFEPQCIFISSGFDAHREDPLGSLTLTEDDFYTLTRLLYDYAAKWAGGRLISVLEGGYNLDALRRSALRHTQGLVDT